MGVLGREPERLDREARDRRVRAAGRGDARLRRAEAGERPGGARRVGEAKTGLDAEAGDPRRDLVHERRLAAEEVGAARDVEQQPVLAVHRAPGREAVAPEGEPLEPLPVRRRVGARCDEVGVQSAGVGKAHAGPQPLSPGLAVDRPQHRPAAARCHQREGDRRGRRGRLRRLGRFSRLSRRPVRGTGAGPRPRPRPLAA